MVNKVDDLSSVRFPDLVCFRVPLVAFLLTASRFGTQGQMPFLGVLYHQKMCRRLGPRLCDGAMDDES